MLPAFLELCAPEVRAKPFHFYYQWVAARQPAPTLGFGSPGCTWPGLLGAPHLHRTIGGRGISVSAEVPA